jgi:hypothetical protein
VTTSYPLWTIDHDIDLEAAAQGGIVAPGARRDR